MQIHHPLGIRHYARMDGQQPRQSFDLKVERAEKHLIELEEAVKRYASGNPYAVRKAVEGKKARVVHRLHFTEQPDPIIGAIAGDFVYNLRSALDFLMVALVPKARSRKVYFPIYFQGVWEEPEKEEDDGRTEERRRWKSDTEGAHAEAVALLQGLQPPEGAGGLKTMHGLIALNRLAVADRHRRMPILAPTLRGLHGSIRGPDGTPFPFYSDGGRHDGLRDSAKIDLPDGAMDVRIEGSTGVIVRVSSQDGGYLIPDVFRNVLFLGTSQVIELLRPFAKP
jgi:hypothetical protein